MKKNIFIRKNYSNNQKKLYLLLIGLAIFSIIIGILFIFFISKDNVSFINQNLNNYFDNYEPSLNIFFKTLFNNFIYVFLIWILGISIIGIPFIILMYLFKNFIFGFSLSSIISTYGVKGILLSTIDLFPHKLLFLVILLLITCYSLSFSLRLIKYLFFKRNINFRESMNKYFKILIISLSVTVFITIYEVFISSLLFKKL